LGAAAWAAERERPGRRSSRCGRARGGHVRGRRIAAALARREVLLPAARQLLADWEEALAAATQRATEESKLLQVGFQTSGGGGLYQDIAARFGELRPDWRLALRAHVWSDPTGGLLDRSSDVAFVWLPAGADSEIEVLPLRSERRYVALPAGHRLARRRAVQMTDMLEEPFVALPPEAGVLRDHWLALEDRGDHPVRIGAEAGTADEAFEAVATGHGVVLLAFVAIAAVNSLVMAVGERAGELALLRLVGATPRQVIRMIRAEALAVIGFGVLVGLAVATATLVPFSLAVAETAMPHLPWQVVAGVITGALLLGLGASELPARNALRRDPVEVIGAQE
jgi:DNA-binding transcriptional LysR family regulator